MPEAHQFMPENVEFIYNQLGCYFDENGEKSSLKREKESHQPSSSSLLPPPPMSSKVVLDWVDEMTLYTKEGVRDYIILITGRFRRIYRVLRMLSHIRFDDINNFIRSKYLVEKIESLLSNKITLILISISALVTFIKTLYVMRRKRKKYIFNEVSTSASETSNTPIPISQQSPRANSRELQVITNTEEKKRQSFGYNATKAFTISSTNSTSNSRVYSPTSTILSGDDGSTILSEAAYKNRRPGANLQSKKTVMDESVKYPAVLIGWQISVAGEVGTVLSAEKNIFRSTVYRIQFADGSTRTLALKRSKKKGKIEFELIKKIN